MKSIIPILLLLVLANTSNAQSFRGADANKLVKGSKQVNFDSKNKTIKHIEFEKAEDSKSLPQNGKDFLKKTLNIPSGFELQEHSKQKDKLGNYVKYQFTYNGIPIESYTYTTQKEGAYIKSAHGHYKAIAGKKSISSSRLTEIKAIDIARSTVKCKKFQAEVDKDFTEEKPALIYIEKNEELVLVYKIDVYCAEPLSRKYIYVNAESGAIEKTTDRIQIYSNNTGTANTKYQGTKSIKTDYYSGSYRLRENSRGNGVETYDLNNGTSYSSAVDFTDTDNIWDATSNQDNAAFDAHYGSEMTYDFFYNKFGRNSIDGAGFALKSYVHYSSGYNNAYWNGSYMTYGDGDGYNMTPLTSIDIVGHEISHGLTSNTAALEYSYESGALNESFSDIFGVAIDFYANPSTANFLMGEQISPSSSPIRSMSNPNLCEQPDTYLGTYWYTGSGDNGGVHYNSGVQNFWFYLLCVGGSGTNDIGSTYAVNAIGMDKAAAIAYRTLTLYLSQNSDYADARYYSIQATIDLYGNCSPEVQNVTNAWYAVGVGAEYSNMVVANFTSSQNYFCSLPAVCTFTNQSTNGSSYEWSFGDGITSKEINPTHTYNAAGSYTVSLITSGTSTCNSNDTVIYSNYINVSTGATPAPAACAPSTVNTSGAYGILNFTLKDINNSSLGASEGYKDNTCAYSTNIIEGQAYNYSATLGSSSLANLKIWIDLNNDGSFNNTDELLASTSSSTALKTGTIIIPHTTYFNIPLRMRIGSDMGSSSNISTACTSSQYGQFEDYSVYIGQNATAPSANFTVDNSSVNTGQIINFTDQSLNLPNNWEWIFAGGTPSSSTAKNPSVSYQNVGNYSVKLKVSNIYGQDSIIKTNYINVVNTFNMCSTSSTNATNGKLFDSGGASGTYVNSENCSFLINPTCANSITLTFNSFNLESSYDYLTIYDGVNANGTQLLKISGTSLPASVTANSGKMFIVFTSDGSVVRDGFEATWVAALPSGNLPISNFNISNTNPALGETVLFTDTSTETVKAWQWNFGDSQSSIAQNPSHKFSNSGTYNVSLIATNCFGTGNSITKTVTVQSPPAINITPASFNESIVGCNDSITKTIQINNIGSGTLNWKVAGSLRSVADNFDAGTNSSLWKTITNANPSANCGYVSAPYSLHFDGNGTRAAITKPFDMSSGGNITFSLEIASGVAPCEKADIGEDVILSYSTNGGTSWNELKTYYAGTYNNFTSINEVIPAAAKSTNTSFKWEQTTNSGTGYDNWAIDNVAITNYTKNQIKLSPDSGTVMAGGNSTINIKFSSKDLNTGIYKDTIRVITNDPLNPVKTIPYSLSVSGAPKINFVKNCSHFGDVNKGLSKTDTIQIINTGCDNLNISNITSSQISVTVNKTNFTVAPGDTGMVLITFAPSTTGNYSGDLTIYNNVTNSTYCFTGSALNPPTISVNPTALYPVINSCTDSISLPLSIQNIGGLDLDFNISNNSNSTIELLVLTSGIDYSEEYAHTMSAINQYFTKYNKTEINTVLASELQAALVGKNVLLIPEQETGLSSTFTNLAPVLQTFVNNGGSVIFCGTSNSCVTNSGLFTGYYSTSSSSSSLTVTDTTHPIVKSVASSFLASNATYYYSFSNTDIAKLVTYGSYDVVSYRTIGKGKAIYIGFDYYAFDNNAARIIANSIEWAGVGNFPKYISLSEASGTIASSNSKSITVKFKSKGLDSGIYNDSIIINSNDPIHPKFSVPFTLTINGTPKLELAKTCSHFGNVDNGLNKYDSLFIYNTGCKTLNITNITSTNSAFTVNKNSISILPGDTALLVINFIPTGIGAVSGNLNITSNAGAATYCLTATGSVPPVLTIATSNVNATLACNDSISIPVTFSNTGGRMLDYSITQTSNFFDDFESGLGNWTKTASWGIVSSAKEGVGALSDSPTGNYSSYAAESIELTKALNITNADSCNLSYWIYRNTESGYDYIKTEISVNGSAWINIATLSGTEAWNKKTFALKPYVKNGDLLKIRFYFTSDGSITSDGVTIDNVSITGIGSGASWYTVSPNSGSVASGASTTVMVKIKSDNVISGIYSDSISFKSNDPIKPIQKLACNLTVAGLPSLSLSKTCSHFGTIDRGLNKKDSLVIYNTGCSTLNISNITSSNATFTTDKSALSIAPRDSAKIYIRFAPLSTGNYNGNLTIYNNDANASYCLSGTADLPPTISVTPSPLIATITTCNDSITVPMTIHNTGGKNLLFDIPQIENVTDNFDPSTNGSLWQSISLGTAASTCGYFSAPNALYFDGSGVRAAITKPLNTNAGGNINFYLKIASGSSPCEAADAGEDITLSYSNNGGATWTIIKTYFTGSYINFTSISETIPPAAQTTATLFKWTQVSHSGSGCDNWSLDNVAINIASAGPKSFSPKSGTIAPGSSMVVDVKLRATNLNAGIYSDSIFIVNNDPLNNKKAVSCMLTVVGTPKLELAKTCSYFGTIINNTVKKDTVKVYNNGCSTLNISSISSNSSFFTVSKSSLTLAPGDSNVFVISFSPSSFGSYTGNISINSNDGNISYCLNGSSSTPARISVTPATLATTLTCNDSIDMPLTINNTGGNILNYEIVQNKYFYDDFETGLSKWTKTGSWGLSSVTKEGTGAITESPSGAYPSNANQYIELTKSLTVSNPDSCKLSYWLYRNTESSFDYIQTLISINGGSWISISNLSGTASWTLMSHNLAGYVSAGNQLKVRFLFTSDGSINNDGVIIDNCKITGVLGENSYANATTKTGSTPASGSSMVNIRFKSNGLAAGVHLDTIDIKSNDPLQGIYKIPVSLTVKSIPSQPSSISGVTLVKNGVETNYSVINVPGTNYIWNVSGGACSGNSNAVDIRWNTVGLQSIVVTPYNSCGNGPSRSLFVSVELPNDIDESLKNKFRFYPNPTVDIVNISMSEAFESDFDIEVFDGNGRFVLKQNGKGNITQHKVDLSGFTTGVYYLKISYKDKAYYTKVIKK